MGLLEKIENNVFQDVIPISRRGDGLPIHPGTAIVPILKEIGEKRLAVIGTGFYVTRYGLVVTAKHVLEELVADNGVSLIQSFVCHLAQENGIYLRKIRKAHLLVNAKHRRGPIYAS